MGKQGSVVLHGAYKGDNFGDTLLLAVMGRFLMRRGYQVYVSNCCERSLEYLDGAFHYDPNMPMDEVRALVLGGGGYLGEQPQNKLRWHLRCIVRHMLFTLKFVRARKKVGIIGVDIGPLSFWPSRVILKRLLAGVDVICGRNDESVEFVRSLGADDSRIHSVADLALVVNELEVDELEQADSYLTSKRRIVIHPSFGIEESRAMKQLADLIREHGYLGEGCELAIMADRDDDATNAKVDEWASYLNVGKDLVYRYQGPWNTCALIRDSSVVVTNKLHTAIVASAFGKGVISLAKHPKNDRYFKQIGRPELNIPLGQFDLSQCEKLIREMYLGDLQPIELSEDVLNRARVNFEKLEVLL